MLFYMLLSKNRQKMIKMNANVYVMGQSIPRLLSFHCDYNSSLLKHSFEINARNFNMEKKF